MATKVRFPLAAALLAAVLLALPATGSAQIPLPPIIPSPTPTPDPEPTQEPTREPDDDDGGDDGRDDDDGGSSGGAEEQPKEERPRTTERRSRPAATVDPIVRKGLAIWEGREKTPARTTTRLLELLDRAEGKVSFDEKRLGFGRFPVVGYVWYQDDYAAPRYLPYFHLHEGTDLFAVSGTPVIACVDGYIWKLAEGGTGGNAVFIAGDDDVRYYYGHLKTIGRGIEVGRRVRVGDVIGTVGATGIAKGTYPHVHFEVNPGGRGTVNPKPVLDAWLSDAEARIAGRLRATRDAIALRSFSAGRWDLLVEMLSEPATLPPALWAGALDSTGALSGFADMVLVDLLSTEEWEAFATPPRGSTGDLGARLGWDRLESLAHPQTQPEAH